MDIMHYPIPMEEQGQVPEEYDLHSTYCAEMLLILDY
jgi:hypothetical protein